MNKINIVFISVIMTVFFYVGCKAGKKIIIKPTEISVDSISDSSRLSFYKGNTIAYVNYLVKNQAKYIGKPLSVLLKDIDLPIYTFYYSPNSSNKYRVTNLILETKPYGLSPRIMNGETQDIEIGIGWQTFVPADSIKAIIKENGAPNFGKWSNKAQEYFGKQIVGNLWLRGYLKR